MHIRGVVRHTLAEFAAGNTVIWYSDPGIGKTDVSFLLHTKLQEMYPGENVGLCRVFMATQQDVDATGLPWRSEITVGDRTYNITKPAMPLWYISTEGKPACTYDRVLLILEEWGQGNAEAKRAFASVLLEKGVPGFYLPPGSHVLALSNTDSRDGVTKEFDFVIGRRKEYRVVGDVKVWDEDFASKPYVSQGKQWNVSSLLRAWAKQRPTHFLEGKPKVQGPWCNPRSACAWDRYQQVLSAQVGGLKALLKDQKLNGEFIEASTGAIGMPATTSLMEFAEFQINLPSYDEVVADPDNCAIPSNADQKMLLAYAMAEWADPDSLDKVFVYFKRMERDLAVTFAQSLIGRDYARFFQHPSMQAFIAKNAALLTALAAATA